MHLLQVKRKYRIAPSPAFSEGRSSKVLLIEGRQREPSRIDREDIKPISKSQVDAYLARMRSMTPQEAAEAAAQAVVEAEVAMAEAEEATRQAEAAEADAETAKAFADAAHLTLKNRNAAKMVCFGFMFFIFCITSILFVPYIFLEFPLLQDLFHVLAAYIFSFYVGLGQLITCFICLSTKQHFSLYLFIPTSDFVGPF